MFKKLAEIRATGQGSVAYIFENGSTQSANINPQIFVDERSGRDKSLNDVMNIFNTTAHDLGAKSFEL